MKSLKVGNSGEVKSKPERRYDIDWLRVLAMLSIFLFHCARFFNYGDWHVKNNQLDLGMSVFVSFVVLWIMPLFFLLSGEGSYFALSFRTSGKYITERFKRLVVPFLFGTFVVLIPLQVYIERVSHSQFVGSFIEFYPHYFDGFYAFDGNFAWMGLHLWFLEFLFIFSLISLPLFLYLRKEPVKRQIHRVAVFFKKPGAIFLLAVPLVIMELLVNLQPEGMGIRDFGGWSLNLYLIFFIYGYLIASDLNFKEAIERHRRIALVMGLITSILWITAWYYFDVLGHNFPSYSLAYIIGAIFRPFSSWLLLVAILGFGSKYLSFNNRVLKYANEAVLPFYILHQTVIVTIGFYIASWNASVIVKYLILSTLSFAVIVSIYDLLIKRNNWLRFLFGMRLKKRLPEHVR